MNPNAINYYNLLSWMNCKLRACQSIEVLQVQQKKIFGKKVKKREFKEGDLVMMFNT